MCKVEGCEEKLKSKGYCQSHYNTLGRRPEHKKGQLERRRAKEGGEGLTPARRFQRARAYGKGRGRVWTLTQEQYLEIVSTGECSYCGRPLPVFGGLDRLDSSKGYEPGNCVPSCHDCNSRKQDRSPEEFKAEIG